MDRPGERAQSATIMAKFGSERQAKLAAALKENLKRRKKVARGGGDDEPPARTLGTAPQAGLENSPTLRPKGSPKAK
jgi:hypothetical protein